MKKKQKISKNFITKEFKEEKTQQEVIFIDEKNPQDRLYVTLSVSKKNRDKSIFLFPQIDSYQRKKLPEQEFMNLLKLISMFSCEDDATI